MHNDAQQKGPMTNQEVALLAEIFRLRLVQCNGYADKTQAIAHTIGSYVCAPIAILVDTQQFGEDYQDMISEYVRSAKHALNAIDEASQRGELSVKRMGH